MLCIYVQTFVAAFFWKKEEEEYKSNRELEFQIHLTLFKIDFSKNEVLLHRIKIFLLPLHTVQTPPAGFCVSSSSMYTPHKLITWHKQYQIEYLVKMRKKDCGSLLVVLQ